MTSTANSRAGTFVLGQDEISHRAERVRVELPPLAPESTRRLSPVQWQRYRALVAQAERPAPPSHPGPVCDEPPHPASAPPDQESFDDDVTGLRLDIEVEECAVPIATPRARRGRAEPRPATEARRASRDGVLAAPSRAGRRGAARRPWRLARVVRIVCFALAATIFGVVLGWATSRWLPRGVSDSSAPRNGSTRPDGALEVSNPDPVVAAHPRSLRARPVRETPPS